MVLGRASVIILAYNNYDNYTECIDSVISQKYKDIEIIISDDCSSSGKIAEVSNYLHKNKALNVIINTNTINLGVIKNYEKCIETSSGEYIFYLAIDDAFYSENVIKNVIDFMNNNNYEICTGYRENIYENGNNIFLPNKYEANFIKHESLNKIISRYIRKPIFMGACTYFKRSLYDKYGFANGGYKHLEDWPRYLRLMQSGVRIGFIDEVLIKYRTYGITSEIKNPELIHDFKKLFDEYMKPPYSKMQNVDKKKYLIAWGAAGGFEQCYSSFRKIIKRDISFIVDSNEARWNSIKNNIPVFSPSYLKKFNKEEIYIYVFSQEYYMDIAEKLENMGYVEGDNFDLISNIRIIGRV